MSIGKAENKEKSCFTISLWLVIFAGPGVEYSLWIKAFILKKTQAWSNKRCLHSEQ